MYLKILSLKFIGNSWENSYTKFVLRDTQTLQSYLFLLSLSKSVYPKQFDKSLPLIYFNVIQFKVVK